MANPKIQILFDEHLARFFYLENGNLKKPKGRKHAKHRDKISWKTEGDFRAAVDFGKETPLMVSRVEVPKNGSSDSHDIIAKDGAFKYTVTNLDTGDRDDPELIVDPDDRGPN